MEDLTLKDCEGIFLKPDCMETDILAAVAEHALVLYHQKKNRKEVPNKMLSLSSSLYSNSKKIPSWYAGRPNSEKKKFCSGGDENKFSMGKSDDGSLVSKSGNCGLKIADNAVANTVLPSGDNLRGKSLVVNKKKFPKPTRKHIESSTEETKISSRREKDPKGKRPMVYQEEYRDDEDYEEPKKGRKTNISNNANGKKTKCVSHGPAIPPPLPQAFKDRLRRLVGAAAVTDPVLVIQKGLYPTDMSKGHNRVTIPFSDIKNKFLTEDEIQELEKYEDNGKNVKKMQVNLIEPCLEVQPVSLRRWAMRKDLDHASISFVLTTTWNKIVLNNHLVAGDVIQVWATRVEGKLWFILVRLTDNPGTSNAHSTAIASSSGSASD